MVPTADAAQDRHVLPGTKPAWATAKADRGSTHTSAAVNVRVYLAGRDPQGLKAYAQAVADPHAAQFHSYLTPAQAKARFGATREQVSAVTRWLRGAGLTVTATNDRFVAAQGAVPAAEHAFSTKLHDYQLGAKTFRAPQAAAAVPNELSGTVLAVTGLDNAPRRMGHRDTLPPPGPVFRNARPCSA